MLIHGWIHEAASQLVGRNRKYTISILHVVKSGSCKVTVGRPVLDGEREICSIGISALQ